MKAAALPPSAWTTGSTEVFKTGTWRAALPRHVTRPSPCKEACPVNGEIATWIGHARTGDFRSAWEVLTRHNPFPAIAGRVCHHPCETACNRAAYDDAVSVCRLERAVGDEAIARSWRYAPPLQERKGRIAVVGAGPSGLSAAYQLRLRGWQVSVYDAQPEAGGVMRYGIPAYRLARNVLDAEIARILDLGVELHMGTRIDAAALDRLQSSHDAVYVATGAARPKALPLLPAGAPWWSFGTDYLERCARGEPPPPAARVLVIGGGSAAMDVARSARRNGSEVALLALEPRDRLPAQGEELREALEEGILLHDGAMLRAVSEDAGALRLECVRVHFAPAAPGAPPRVTPLPGSDFVLHVEHILVAIGQDAELSGFAGMASANGVITTTRQQRTSAPAVWAGGDVATVAARFVTEAVGMGKRAALDIDAALQERAPAAAASLTAALASEIATWYHAPAPRAPQHLREAGERLARAAAEVQLALTREEAESEAARCFSCGTCTSCDNCFQLCPDLAIEKVDGGYRVLADYCKGCGICVRECPTGAMLLEEEAR